MEVLADEESSSGRYGFLQRVADGGVQVAEWSRWIGSMMWRNSRPTSFFALVGVRMVTSAVLHASLLCLFCFEVAIFRSVAVLQFAIGGG